MAELLCKVEDQRVRRLDRATQRHRRPLSGRLRFLLAFDGDTPCLQR